PAPGARVWAGGGQRVCRASGQRLLNGAGPNAIPFTWITSQSDGQSNAIIPDGAGGCILTWRDDRDVSTTDDDVYAQHLTAAGAVAAGWNADGVPLCTAPGSQNGPSRLPDGAGGAIATWYDLRPGVFAQHVTSSGVVDGPAGGLTMSSAGGTPADFFPLGVSDGAGGAIFFWGNGNFASNAVDI